MNSAMWTYFFLIVGIFGIVIINLFSDMLLINEQNYMLTKEVTEAALLDSVDVTAFRVGVGYDNDYSSNCMANVPGTLAILPDKFVENFIRRFAESATIGRDYQIDFHLVQSCPPEVIVSVKAKEVLPLLNFFTVDYNSGIEMNNRIAAILETKREFE